MSNRFTTLYKIPENLYSIGSPIIIVAGALLKDNQTDKVLAQLKFKSISNKKIKAIKISVKSFDVAGTSIGDIVEHQYLDLTISRNDEFGSKELIPLSLNTARSFDVKISTVIYLDNSIWEASNDAAWDPLISQPTLLSVLKDEELVKQYMIETGSISKFVPIETADLWLCSCGAANHKGEEHCVLCSKALSTLLEKLDIPMLTKKKQTKIEEERVAREEAEELYWLKHKAKQEEAKLETIKKMKKPAIIIAYMVVVVIGGIVIISQILGHCRFK